MNVLAGPVEFTLPLYEQFTQTKVFGKGLDSKTCIEGLVERGNLRSICMAVVMREV